MSFALQEQLQASLAPGYTIERELGRGAMATVFLAQDDKHSRHVAVKVLDPELAASLGPERFLTEIRLTAHLQHPNVLPLFDSGTASGLLFYVMPFVAGETLRQKLEREGKLPVDEALRITCAVGAALDYAHRNGVVHRDIKPENVLLSDGVPMIADFGIAKALSSSRIGGAIADPSATQAGLALGTPNYMSPEQAMGESVDGRSDIYALGCMLYEMLSGDVPFSGPSAHAIVAKHLTSPVPAINPTREAVPLSVDAAIACAMAKVPDDRFATASKFGEALMGTPVARPIDSSSRLTSVAVLPFVFLSDVGDARALSLGFADALITIFGKLEDTVVAPTSAILNYVAGAEPQQVCKDLGVRHALQGTVQKLGAHWRVSIQLFDAWARRTTLSDTHDFVLEDLFEAQDEIGRRVLESLQSRFLPALPKSRDRYSSEPEAYFEYITGLSESFSDKQDVLLSAANHLETAVNRDPGFALAHATLSLVAANIHFAFDPRPSWIQKAEQHCGEALALDPSLAEAHLARAWILWSPAKNFQHAEAISALEQVLAVQPHLERAHNRMSSICAHIGRMPEARIAHEAARRANPKTRTGNLEFFYMYSGDFARADEAVEEWFRERPDNLYALHARILISLLRGDLELAEERLAVGLKRAPDGPQMISVAGMFHARRHETERALECVGRALEVPHSFGHTHHAYYQIACVFAVLGKTDLAMAWLERSVETGFACWPFFRLDPHLASLHNEPAFTRLVGDLEAKYTALQIHRL